MMMLIAAVLVAASVSANALTAEQLSVIENTISGAKLAKVGTVASELVTKATEADRKDVVVQVVRATKSHKAGALVQTVVAISKENPDMAPLAASTAVSLSKRQAVKIAKAAMQAAPAYVENISREVAVAAPQYAAQVLAAATPKVPVFPGKDAYGNDAGYASMYSPVALDMGTSGDRRQPAYDQP
ncbi:MAG: hypothetical protein ACOX2U_04175 [Limisphaerales bacterium]|nr:hypothetical protein [Verrucomicrobiota bacterium]